MLGVRYALNGAAIGAVVILKPGVLNPTWPVQFLQSSQASVRSGSLAKFFQDLDARHLDLGGAARDTSVVFEIFWHYGLKRSDVWMLENAAPFLFPLSVFRDCRTSP